MNLLPKMAVVLLVLSLLMFFAVDPALAKGSGKVKVDSKAIAKLVKVFSKLVKSILVTDGTQNLAVASEADENDTDTDTKKSPGLGVLPLLAILAGARHIFSRVRG